MAPMYDRVFMPEKIEGTGENRGIGRRPVRIRLRTPPPSLRKTHISDMTPNRAFSAGISGHSIRGFGLCRRSRTFGTNFGALSLHPKIPFPADGLPREFPAVLAPRSNFCADANFRYDAQQGMP